MNQSCVTWHRPSEELPDDEETVLLALHDGEVWTGYYEAGEWFYVSADSCEATVVWWARFPDPPAESDQRHADQAEAKAKE